MFQPRSLPDNFTLALIASVLLASFLPCRDQVAMVFNWLTNIGIGLLFFLRDAKLSLEAIFAGMTHWRLYALVFSCTFVTEPSAAIGAIIDSHSGLVFRHSVPLLSTVYGTIIYRLHLSGTW